MTAISGAAGAAGAQASTAVQSSLSLGLTWHNVYSFECYGADGILKWREDVLNTVCDAGANDLLNKYFAGSGYTATWFVGLTTGTTFANGDTAASHVGWTEFTAYSQTNRPTWSGGAASARSISNSGSQAVFSINASGTVAGAFLISEHTIGGGTGTLYGEAALSSSRTLASGDTLNITVTLSV